MSTPILASLPADPFEPSRTIFVFRSRSVWLYSTAHLGMIAVQIVGSIWIRKLSPAWEPR